jgi:hypothetical protein
MKAAAIREDTTCNSDPTTHIILGLRVGAGIDQQTHAIRVTTGSGLQQRRPSALRVIFSKAIKPRRVTRNTNQRAKVREARGTGNTTIMKL